MRYEQIQDAAKATKNQVKHCIEYLKKSHMIATQKATRGMHVTVCKYAYYQDAENYKSHTERKVKGTRKEHESHTKDNKKKNDKNEKNKEVGEGTTKNILLQTSKDLLSKKSHKDFSHVTEDHETFVETFITWVRWEHATYWQGWVKGCRNELELYIKTYNAGLDTIDKLQRIDGYTTEEIFRVCRWAMEDKFWKKQFRSLVKLRRKNAEGVKYIVEFTDRYEKSDQGRLENWIKGGL